MSRNRALIAGGLAALAVAAAWIGLTAATGATYHLAPLIGAAAPGAVARGLERPVPRLAAAALGAVAVALGWAVIVIAGIEPSATIVADQPGGVAGEVVAGGALGAATGAWLATPGRPRTA